VDIEQALRTSTAGTDSDQVAAVRVLVVHVDDRRATTTLLDLMAHTEDLAPIIGAADALLASGSDPERG
jgi:hypothetical protein